MKGEGMHHLHLRKRMYKKLEPYPHPVAWKRFLDYFMYVVAVIAPIALVPQVWSVYATKNVSGLVVAPWILLGAMHILWAFYGTIHRELPLVVTSVLFACMNFSLLLGILLYR